MTTLRREAIQIAESILIPAFSDNPQTQDAINYAKEQAEKVVDALIVLRGFSFLATDEEQGEYKPAFDEEKADISWAVHAGKKVTPKQLFKREEIDRFENEIEAEMKRLRLNWTAFDEKAKDIFRRFLRGLPDSQTLSAFVSWWLTDEWRAANPPWTLAVIMQRWLQAFPAQEARESVPQRRLVYVDGRATWVEA